MVIIDCGSGEQLHRFGNVGEPIMKHESTLRSCSTISPAPRNPLFLVTVPSQPGPECGFVEVVRGQVGLTVRGADRSFH